MNVLNLKPFVLTLIVLITGCATVHAEDSQLRKDLQAATTMACAKDAAGDVLDPAVCQCNTYLLATGIPDVQNLGSGIEGPISAAERVRIIKRTGVVGKAKEQLNMACAAAWMSIKGDLIDLGLMLKALK